MRLIVRIKFLIRKVTRFLLDGVWNLDSHNYSKRKNRLVRHLKVTLITHRHFQSLRCGREAVALSFFTTMATVPLLAVILIIANRFGLSEIVSDFITSSFLSNPDIGNMIMGWATNIMDLTSRGGFGLTSFITFLWLVIWMMLSVENAFNHIWKVKKSRNIFRRVAVYISILILTPFILVMFFYGATYFTKFIGYIGDSQFVDFVTSYLFWIILYGLSVMVISLMYKIIPHAKIKYVACFKAALISGLGFTAIQYFYLETQIMATRLNTVYGIVAAIPLYMLWLNFCWFDILFGVDLSYAFQHVNEYNPQIDEPR